MRFHYLKTLYTNDWSERKIKRIKKKLRAQKTMFSLYLITIPEKNTGQLEIYNSLFFKQPILQDIIEDVNVVGFASSYGEALELVKTIVDEVLDKTGGLDIRSYIKELNDDVSIPLIEMIK